MQCGKGKGWAHLSRGICHGYLPISSGPDATDIRIVHQKEVSVPMPRDTGKYPWHRHNYCIVSTTNSYPEILSSALLFPTVSNP